MTGHTAETHKRIRKEQNKNKEKYHHPKEKMIQLDKFKIEGKVLEVFAGEGNLTKYYKERGCEVTPMTKEKFGNSFEAIYKLRALRNKFDWIDIDSYGYPDRFFPIVFEMLRDPGYIVITFPQVGVNCHNGITQQHMSTFYRNPTPTIGDVVGTLTDYALREWMLLKLEDVVKIDRIYRFIFSCKRVKATEMTYTVNRPEDMDDDVPVDDKNQATLKDWNLGGTL